MLERTRVKNAAAKLSVHPVATEMPASTNDSNDVLNATARAKMTVLRSPSKRKVPLLPESRRTRQAPRAASAQLLRYRSASVGNGVPAPQATSIWAGKAASR